MKAISLETGKEIKAGDVVKIYKYIRYNEWQYTSENGIFEEVTPAGLVNFTDGNGNPRQSLAEGIGAKVE